jgi:hypothetical protein
VLASQAGQAAPTLGGVCSKMTSCRIFNRLHVGVCEVRLKNTRLAKRSARVFQVHFSMFYTPDADLRRLLGRICIWDVAVSYLGLETHCPD